MPEPRGISGMKTNLLAALGILGERQVSLGLSAGFTSASHGCIQIPGSAFCSEGYRLETVVSLLSASHGLYM